MPQFRTDRIGRRWKSKYNFQSQPCEERILYCLDSFGKNLTSQTRGSSFDILGSFLHIFAPGYVLKVGLEKGDKTPHELLVKSAPQCRSR